MSDVSNVVNVRRLCAVLLLALGAVLAMPVRAAAVTVDQVVALSKAGISEAVILALIDRDRTIFTIEPEQIVTLKRDGLTDTVITAMLKSGRTEGDEAARADSAFTAAAILSNLSPAPEVTVIGHGPERPNTVHPDGFWNNRRGHAAVSDYAPYAAPRMPRYLPPYAPQRSALDRERMLCLASSTTSPVAGGPSLTYLTECPPVMQRALRPSR